MKEAGNLPLPHRVTFKALAESESFSCAKSGRRHYKLESSQTLKVSLRIFNLGFKEDFWLGCIQTAHNRSQINYRSVETRYALS